MAETTNLRQMPGTVTMSLSFLPSYRVNVENTQKVLQGAILMPSVSSSMQGHWECNWPNLWKTADFDCDAIIEMSFQGQVVGLIKFGLYPYAGKYQEVVEYLHILNIETVQSRTRLCRPVGFWLIWYAVQVALFFCSGDCRGSIVTLDSYDRQMSYYRDKVRMDVLGATTIAPGEEGYAFRFTEEGAVAFSTRLECNLGFPVRISL